MNHLLRELKLVVWTPLIKRRGERREKILDDEVIEPADPTRFNAR
jgi:hypothetical protein